VIPLAVVLTTMFNLGMNLVVAFVFILAFGYTPAWSWLMLVPVLIVMFVFTTAVSMIVSSLYPRFRDIGIIWSVFAMALFYATPVLYPVSVVSAHLRDVIALNPLTPILDLAQRWITEPSTPWPAAAAVGGPVRLAIAAVIYVAVCGFAVWIFRREAPRIAEAL
jgi:ABC-2 type transport system permease protein